MARTRKTAGTELEISSPEEMAALAAAVDDETHAAPPVAPAPVKRTRARKSASSSAVAEPVAVLTEPVAVPIDVPEEEAAAEQMMNGAHPHTNGVAHDVEVEAVADEAVEGDDAGEDDGPGWEPGGNVQARTVNVSQGAAQTIRGQNIRLEQSAAAVIQGNRVDLDASGAFAIIGRRVDAKDSGAFIVIARNATGFNAALDWRGALILLAGWLVLGRLFRRGSRRA